MSDKKDQLASSYHLSLITYHLLGLFVSRMATAAAAEFPEFEAFRRRLLILRRHVVAIFALGTLQRDVVAWHNSPSKTFKRSAFSF
jgi:hypothetical protein